MGSAQSAKTRYSVWAMWPAKITVLAALGALSAYHGRQAAEHREYAQHLRTAQLELHNLGPYLAELQPDQRAEVRKDLVRTFFGKASPEVKQDSPTTTITLDQAVEVLRLLIRQNAT